MVKQTNQWLFPLIFLGVTAVGVALCISAFRQGPARQASSTPAPISIAAPVSPALPSSPSASHLPAASWPPEEIFRRAFWRQPTAQDRILHAERREATAPTPSPSPAPHADVSPPSLERWQWFLALHPSPELLRTLRDPNTFGLISTATPLPWSEAAPDPLPTWFPSTAQAPEFEVLQAPAGRLTLLYRAQDNTLFATDTGAGFSPAVQHPR